MRPHRVDFASRDIKGARGTVGGQPNRMITPVDMEKRPRFADLGIELGTTRRGPANSLVDVPGVLVGNCSVIHGDENTASPSGPARTGVTCIFPKDVNLYKNNVRAAVHVFNGFGKSVGLVQIAELGVLESPLLLTNTLSVWLAADSLAGWLSDRNPGSYTFNPVVMECNDGYLNDIIGQHVKHEHVIRALDSANSVPFEEGCVGAGVGMTGYGWKAGIGTSSRRCVVGGATYTVGVLVLTNTGAAPELRIGGVSVGLKLQPPDEDTVTGDGSIIIVIGLDAPLSSRQLLRVARRGVFGLARTGVTGRHGSGDFILAFSNSADPPSLRDEELNLFFAMAVDATEEAIINSLLQARTTSGIAGHIRHAIPVEALKKLLGIH